MLFHLLTSPSSNRRGDIARLAKDCIYTLFFVTAAVAGTASSMADVISETVKFDGDEYPPHQEFCRRFNTFGNAFTVVTTGGITGGALVPKGITDSLNDISVFDTWFLNTPGEEFEGSVDYYHKPDAANPNIGTNYRTEIVLNLSGQFPNYDLRFGVTRSADAMTGYIWSIHGGNIAGGYTQDSLGSGNYVEGWYRMVYGMENIGGEFNDEFIVKMSLYYLGLDGISEETEVASFEQTVFEYFRSSTRYYIPQLTAQHQNGCVLVDNFRFTGLDELHPDAVPVYGSRKGDVVVDACLHEPENRSLSGQKSGSIAKAGFEAAGKMKPRLGTLRKNRKNRIYFGVNNISRYNDQFRFRRQSGSKRKLLVSVFDITAKRKNVTAKSLTRGAVTQKLARGYAGKFQLELIPLDRFKKGAFNSKVTSSINGNYQRKKRLKLIAK